MFGMGFMEILLIAVIAIIALGPEKLPTAMVEVAKFIKKFKSGVNDAKATLDSELKINEMKEEADKFKSQFDNAKSMASLDNLDLGLDELDDNKQKTTQTTTQDIETTNNVSVDKETKQEKVSFKNINTNKKELSNTQIVEESKESVSAEAKTQETSTTQDSDKFKVKFENKESTNA